MPLIEDRFRPSSMAVASRCTTAPTAAWCTARYGQDGSRFREAGLGELVAADHAALADEAFATALMTTMSEAFRQGVRGYAQDIVAQGSAWSFDPSMPGGAESYRADPASVAATIRTRLR